MAAIGRGPRHFGAAVVLHQTLSDLTYEPDNPIYRFSVLFSPSSLFVS